jgi:MFS family permease
VAKFGWDDNQTRLWNTLIGNSSLLGMTISSAIGGPLIVGGRRRMIIIMNSLVFLGAGLTLAQTTPTIIIGRFIYGFVAGILTMCTSKCIFETVPMRYAGIFGCLTNVFIHFTGFICLLLGNALPSSPNDYKDD